MAGRRGRGGGDELHGGASAAALSMAGESRRGRMGIQGHDVRAEEAVQGIALAWSKQAGREVAWQDRVRVRYLSSAYWQRG